MGRGAWIRVAIGFAAALCVIGCDRGELEDRGDGRPEAPESAGASQEIQNFTLRETDAEGRLSWVMRARGAQVFETRNAVEADSIRIDFFDRTGELASVLTAERGVIARASNDMRATGNVLVRNRDGHELRTEELAFAAGRNKIYTEHFVTMIRGRDVLTGYGLETDPDLEGGQFEIQRDVRATVRDLPAAPADSISAPADTTKARADTTKARADTTKARADSAKARSATGAAPADSSKRHD
jgi:LPS export ABC transporter protein LptC